MPPLLRLLPARTGRCFSEKRRSGKNRRIFKHGSGRFFPGLLPSFVQRRGAACFAEREIRFRLHFLEQRLRNLSRPSRSVRVLSVLASSDRFRRGVERRSVPLPGNRSRRNCCGSGNLPPSGFDEGRIRRWI